MLKEDKVVFCIIKGQACQYKHDAANSNMDFEQFLFINKAVMSIECSTTRDKE